MAAGQKAIDDRRDRAESPVIAGIGTPPLKFRSPKQPPAMALTFGLDNVRDYNHNVVIMLGEFEYLLLTAALRLGADAYGAAIRLEIESSTRRRCSLGALYTTLDRLEEKGLIETWMGSATPQRGGRSKRMVRVTSKGSKAAAAFYLTVTRASHGLSWETSRERGRL